MAKKKPARKSKKLNKKKPARPTKKKKVAAPRKTARSKKAAPNRKKKLDRRKTTGTGVVIEVAEVELIGEPEDVADDEVFPPDYGGSE